MMAHELAAALLLIVARVFPLFFRPHDILFSDVLAHSMMVRYGKARPRELLHAGRNYPVVIHYLLARLPLPPRAFKFVPVLMDLLLFSLLALALHALRAKGIIADHAAVTALYLFALYPAFVIQFYGPRSYGLNERIAAEVLFNIAVLILIVWPSFWTAAISTVLLAILLLGSKFSIQAIVLVLLPAGVWLGSWPILASLAAAFLLALLTPGQNFAGKLRRQARHLLWYVDYLRQPDCWAGARNRLPWPRKGESSKSALWRIFRFFTRDNAISAGLLGHGLLLLALAMTAGAWPGDGPVHAAIVFTLAGTVAWLLTSFGVFKVLGEAERYLNYAAGPGFIVMAWAMSRLPPPLWLKVMIFAMLALMWLAVMAYLVWTNRRLDARRRALDPIVAWLRENDMDSRVISLLPTHECWALTAALLERFWWFDCFMRADWKQLLFRYPYPLCSTITAGGHKLLVTSEKALAGLAAEEPCYEEIRHWRLLHKSGGYLIYAIPSRDRARA